MAIDFSVEPEFQAKLDWVELGFHAMGTASPEFPTVVYPAGFGANSLNSHRIADFVLEEGMTFHCIPAIWLAARLPERFTPE